MPKPALIVMAKWPEPGAVKTRLCPPLKPEEAAELYEAMLRDVLESSNLSDISLFLAFHPEDKEKEFRALAGKSVSLVPQRGETLVHRMNFCFEEVFAKGYAPVLMRNSDAPTFPETIIRDALLALEAGTPAVFSPDESGGFGLVGLSKPFPDLWKEPLASEDSYEEILRRSARLGIETMAVQSWYDVDTPKDLRRLLEEWKEKKTGRHVTEFFSAGGRGTKWLQRVKP
ncbi:MAG: TIGR04282 family arsenosugar biosynthesis glycosyltransferase [Bdellovibrionota bacterium]